MYLFVIWCVIASFVSSKSTNQEVFKLPQEKILLAQKHAQVCAEKHNVENGILKRVVDGTLPRDEPTKKFLHCFGRSLNMTAEDGHIIVDRMSSMIGDHPLLEEFKESLRACNKVTKDNPLDTIMEMNTCMTNNAPIIFSV